MNGIYTIKMNFTGGIISPGDLHAVLSVAGQAGVKQVSFGLRQQLLMDVEGEFVKEVIDCLEEMDLGYEIDKDDFPNIVSSYPAEDIFINHTWLSEGVYKDILDEMDHKPRLKINLSDSNQSFTPLLTGNINWVASAKAEQFWHLFIRFPKTNNIFEWSEMVYTNDVARLSKEIEHIIFADPDRFFDNSETSGDDLFRLVKKEQYITQAATAPAQLPDFNLPYYEGLHRHNNKNWLGIYRRDEMFPIAFLKELCLFCLETKVGQLCSTPWKSVIVKGIENKDRLKWSVLLDKHEINMRHAANELNFQVQDNDPAARKLKSFIVKELNAWDIRSFGLCIGIKTKNKTEIFSSILIKRKPLLKIFGFSLFYVYDILYAKDFNPNERTGKVFISNITKWHLADELHRSIRWFYKNKTTDVAAADKKVASKERVKKEVPAAVYQCRHCLTVYDSMYGDPENGVLAGTRFEALPETYCCPVCDASKQDFEKVDKAVLVSE